MTFKVPLLSLGSDLMFPFPDRPAPKTCATSCGPEPGHRQQDHLSEMRVGQCVLS